MNLKELSRITNFSVSTISKAFSNADDISEEAKKIIFDTAKKHGCFGKYYKGKFHKKIIVIVCPEINSGFYAQRIDILKKLIEDDGGIVLVSMDDFETNKQCELIEYYASYLRVDGIFVLGLNVQPKKGYETPIVALGTSSDLIYLDSVNSITSNAYSQAIEYLISLGHTNIAFAGEKHTVNTAVYIDECLKKHGLELTKHIVSNERFEKAGIDAAEQLAKMEEMSTAVICAYDNIAIGLIKGLRDVGYSVPEDVSVIGKDDISVSEYILNKLSTISIKHEETCELAWDLMKKKIENPYYILKQRIDIFSEFIARDTTAAPRKK